METKAPDNNDQLATLVITINLSNGDVRIAGNVLKDTNLALRMLIEAAHRVIISTPEPLDNQPLTVA